mgnify:FL=1|jgi:hypothetical protein
MKFERVLLVDAQLGQLVQFQAEAGVEFHLNQQGFLRPALFQSWHIPKELSLVHVPQTMEVEPR